jgi:glucose-1-phosphate adenylyltransferase
MDYSKMLEFHVAHRCDLTIAVREVPLEEASRMGIMNAREDGSIYEFEEKPKSPKSNLASMGVYIFTWGKLREALIADNKAHNDSDFGKHIIPRMLRKIARCMPIASRTIGKTSAPSKATGNQTWN